MLRVGLTGDLGSGKSTVAKMLAARGAIVFSSDEMARQRMQPGEAVYAEIVARFGESILTADKTIDRRKLAQLAFDPANPRVEELNAIVHPAVLSAQADQINALARTQPDAIVVVESALIFSTKHSGNQPWRDRFDAIILVTAPQEQKLARFVERMSAGQELSATERAALEADAQQRLAQQILTKQQTENCIFLSNSDGLQELETKVNDVWLKLEDIKRNL